MGFVKEEHRGIYKGVHKDKSLSAWADQQGYILTFKHVASQHSTSFPATITKFSDSHTSDLKLTRLMDESDPIVRTKHTAREISFSFFVANASLDEARHNEQNLNLLMCMMYPARDTNAKLQIPGTMVKIKGVNIIDSGEHGGPIDKDGVSGYISSLTYSPDIEAGFITSKATGIFGEDEIYPAKIELSIKVKVRIPMYVDDNSRPLPRDYPSYR